MTQNFEYSKGRFFVSGLFWQPISAAPSDVKRESAKLAAELEFDLIVRRDGGTPQVGLCSSKTGAKAKMLSAAAMVAKTITAEGDHPNFICVTEVPGGKWLYVAQRDGVILPDGDLIGGEDEIRSRVLQDRSISAWEVLYAPAHWGLSGSIDRTFESLIVRNGAKLDFGRWCELAPVKKSYSQVILPLAGVCALAALAFIGHSQWESYKFKQNLAAQQNEAQTVKPEHPWKTQPRAMQFASACMGSLAKVRSFWPGNWTPIEATCSRGGLTVKWDRAPHGWIEHILLVEPEVIVANGGESASLVIPFDLPQGEDESVPTLRKRTLEMHSIAQRYGIKLAIAASTPHSSLPGQRGAENVAAQDWSEITWEASGPLSPATTIAMLEGNGLRIKTIKASFNGGGFIWNIEGSQYVQP
ncbi:MAG: type 4b pilus protein PilO2 [Methanoregula sp.]|nr:type 4b pilus protein PilO2 [Methanoregula sp.]